MTQPPDPADSPKGERLARRLARAGVASRRAAEGIIEAGRVKVNGRVVATPAFNVTEADRVELDGRPLAAPEPARLWRYHKPAGLVTTESDEKGRATVFERLPAELPRVLSVGRLDLNSEGLLLLTNDGDLKRRLELPSTGWMRKYRVRVHGAPTDEILEPLRRGMVVEGERFQPMTVTLDRQQGANAWLTVGLREGRNREVRRALGALELEVLRLIRISYGPFLLGDLKAGAVEEIRPKVLRDQLGLGPAPKESRAPGAGARKPGGAAKPGGKAGGAKPTPGKPGGAKPGGGKPRGKPEGGADPDRSSGRGKPGPARRPGTDPPRGGRPGRGGPRRG